MNAWFADTFYWIALLNQADVSHEQALALNQHLQGIFVTTQWVLAEVLDGCASVAQRHAVLDLIRPLHEQEDVIIVPATDEWFQRGLKLYEARPDKEWSLTDCISFLVMADYDLMEALTGDHHFEQAGFIILLKQGNA